MTLLLGLGEMPAQVRGLVSARCGARRPANSTPMLAATRPGSVP